MKHNPNFSQHHKWVEHSKASPCNNSHHTNALLNDERQKIVKLFEEKVRMVERNTLALPNSWTPSTPKHLKPQFHVTSWPSTTPNTRISPGYTCHNRASFKLGSQEYRGSLKFSTSHVYIYNIEKWVHLVIDNSHLLDSITNLEKKP
jgi:hypothetical protein